MRTLKVGDLSRIKGEVLSVWELKKGGDTVRITVHMGTCGISSGADKILKVLQEEKVHAGRQDIAITTSGCAGICNQEPLITVEKLGEPPIKYANLDEARAREIFRRHVLEGLLNPDWVFARGWEQTEKASETAYPAPFSTIPHIRDIPFFGMQEPIVMKNRGLINAEKIEEYIARDGYFGAARALHQMGPEAIIEEVTASGIRGRGGAGFPTGMKWRFAASSQSDVKYVLCNADEGDPGAFMDRCVLESDPHAVLEGMIIAAKAIGSRKGYIYCRAEYPLAVKMLNLAIQQARAHGLLGANILDSGFDFDIEVYRGAGAFVCGEETALMTSIEGKRGMPRPRPPFPAVQGLWKKPTILNNVETLANIPQIILKGGAWYAGYGTLGSKGTKVFALTGDVRHVGLVEVPMGTPLDTVINEIGGGVPEGKKFKAVQLGGPSGGCIPAQFLDTPVDYESIIKKGAIVGSGGMIVMDEDKCMVDVARYFMAFCREESCGKCIPCRVGTDKMLEILTRICEGRGEAGDIETLERWSGIIKNTALCGLGQTVPNPVLSTLQYFRHEYEAHVIQKRCPAGVCRALVARHALADRCLPCLRSVAGYDAGGFENFRRLLPELVPADIAASIAEKGCAVDLARFSMIVSADNQTCTKCSSCRLGVAQALVLLNDIAAGRGTFEMLDLLEELAETIQLASDCPVGKSAPSILQFTLNHFRDQFEAHVRDKRCPAGVCGEQIAYAATCCLKTEASPKLGGAEP